MSETGINVALTGDPSGGQAAIDAMKKAGEDYMEAVVRQSAQVVRSLDTVTAKLDDLGRTHKESAAKSAEAMSGLKEGVDAFGKKFEEAFSSKAILGEMASGILGVVAPLALLEAGMEGVKEVFSEIVNFSKEGILKADEIRDLSLSLAVFTGSAEKGDAVLAAFEKRMGSTRNTARELANTFRDLSPVATGRGFSIESQEDITVMLSQLATMRGQTLDEMEVGMRSLMSGRAMAGRNPLLAALGINKGDIKDLNWDLIIDKMHEVTGQFGEFGDSFESEMKKIKEGILENFGEGFNGARDKAKTGLDGIQTMFEDLGPTIKDFGALVAQAVGTIATLGQTIGPILKEIKADFDVLTDSDFLSKATGFSSLGGTSMLDVLSHLDPTGLSEAARSIVTLAKEAAANASAAQARDLEGAGYSALNAAGMTPLSEYSASVYARGNNWQRRNDQFIVSKTDFPGGESDLEAQIGKFQKGANESQFAKFIADLKKDVADGILSLDEFKKAQHDAMAPVDHPHGHVVPSTKDDSAKLLAEQKRELAEILHLKEGELTSNEKLLVSQLGINKAQLDAAEKLALLGASGKFGVEATKVEYEQKKELLTLNEQIAVQQFKMQGDELKGVEELRAARLQLAYDKKNGNAAEVAADEKIIAAIKERNAVQLANDRTEIAGTQARIDGNGAYFDQLRNGVQANYWKDFTTREEDALAAADNSMSQFLEHAKDKLAYMVPAVAESIRASLAAIESGEQATIQMLFAAEAAGFGAVTPDTIAFLRQKAQTQAGTAFKTGEEEERIAEQQMAGLIRGERVFAQQFSTDFAAIIESGGHNFTQIIAGGFKQTVADSVDILSKYIIGSPGDPKKADASGGVQMAGHMYDPAGHDISLSFASQVARPAFEAAQIGFAGYQAGQSGVPGSRTGAELGGAVAGASTGALIGSVVPGLGTAIGAVAGFAIAAIAGAYGAQQRQADYKYGTPQVDSSGVAHFVGTQNYGRDKYSMDPTPTTQEWVVIRQIQGVYDSIHDSLAMILIKAGALLPIAQGINGKVQDNPSGHYEEHLQQYLTGTLPTALMGQFKDELTTLAGTFGMSADRFKEIWAALQNLDPTTAVGLLGTMFDALGTFGPSASRVVVNKDGSTSMPGGKENIYDITHYTDAITGFNPAAHMLGNIDHQSQMNPGQIVHEMDDEILNLAANLKNLSPEGQINAEAQLSQMVKNRYQAMYQEEQKLFALVKQIDAQSDATVKNFEAQKILKDDGTADQFGLSQFYKKSADQDLRDIQNAKNADQEATAWAKFQQDVQQAEQFGYAQDPTKAGKQAWAQWGIDNLKLGQTIADQIAASIGMSLNPEQAAFNAKFDPLIDLFKNGITKMLDPTGGTDPNDPDKNPINKANALLANNTNALAASLTTPIAPLVTLGGALNGLIDDIGALRDEIRNGAGGNGTGRSSASGFIARTQASRAA